VEWITLENQLGGPSVSGGALKSTSGWNNPNTGATNSTGFSGLPGSCRYPSGSFENSIGDNGHFWSATEWSSNNARFRTLYYSGVLLGRNDQNKQYGFSVRCIRD